MKQFFKNSSQNSGRTLKDDLKKLLHFRKNLITIKNVQLFYLRNSKKISIARSSVELDTSASTAFDQFVTPANVRRPSTVCLYHCNIFFINKLYVALRTKLLKKIHVHKITHIIFTKVLLLFFPLDLRCFLTKTFFMLSNVFLHV